MPVPGDGTTAVRVVSLTYNDAKFWHQSFQPDIDRIRARLDYGWDWAHTPFWLSLVEALNRREMVGYAIMMRGMRRAVPAGLLLLSVGYPALDEPGQRSVYLWYLATAPAKSLRRFGVMVKPPLLEALVDIGMVESEARGYGGRVYLHAANRGNSPASQSLYDAYGTRCGLNALPKNLRLPGIRRNDGRYFGASSMVATARMTALDSDR